MNTGDKRKLQATNESVEEHLASVDTQLTGSTGVVSTALDLASQYTAIQVTDEQTVTVSEVTTADPEAKDGAETSNGGEGSTYKKRKTAEDAEGNVSSQGEHKDLQAESWTSQKQHRKTQKKMKKPKKSQVNQACFMLSRDYNKLSIKDVRDLTVYLLTETKTLPWILVKNKSSIQKVVMLYIAGLDPQFFNVDLEDPESSKPIPWAQKATNGPATEFQRLRTFFDVMNVMKAGGDKYRVHPPVDTLLSVPLSNSERLKREHEMKSKRKAIKSARPETYMMSLQELKDTDFPLPSYLSHEQESREGWIETERITATPAAPKKMIAMDCEMCRTTVGSELTRVSLVDEEGVTIYDELVMPDNPIVDYLTQYSGMTAERLEGVTTKLADVQKKLQELITYDVILVGHSLENDMKVLQFAHPFIIDTTIVYHHTRGPPFRASLKWLAQKWLSRKIQLGGESGHDSEEDARSCMDLVKLKIKEGPGFGEYNTDQDTLFSRLFRHTKCRTSAVIDREYVFGQGDATAVIQAADDAEVVNALPGAIQEHNFVWARLRAMEVNYGKAPSPQAGGQPSQLSNSGKREAAEASTEDELREAVRSIDQSIATIVESLPENTALIVTSGQGDLREVMRMQGKQRNFQKLYSTVSLSAIPKEDQFLEDDQKALQEAVDRAKNGVCFFMVK